MSTKIANFCRREFLLLLSAVLALASMFFAPFRPDQYFSADNLRTIALLFCLMLTVKGMAGCGLFERLGVLLVRRLRSPKLLLYVLILAVFALSMLITNDVALLTFVPILLALPQSVLPERQVPRYLTLTTIAANLGSMLLPTGNPQNLFLFSAYNLSPGGFVTVMLPYTLTALVLLSLSVLIGRKAQAAEPVLGTPAKLQAPARLAACAVLFAAAVLASMGVLPYLPVLIVCLAFGLLFARRALLSVDYSLLGTFLFLFVFTANLSAVAPVRGLLEPLCASQPFLTGVAASQLLSNVPAAVLLRQFTADGAALLAGVNAGGLGTLIAAMTNVIAFRFYMAKYAGVKRYLGIFTLLNLLYLAAMIGVYYLLPLL